MYKKLGLVRALARACETTNFYRFAVNPVHLDEWLHWPLRWEPRPGMALQMDIIPVSLGPFCYVNTPSGALSGRRTTDATD